MRPEVFSGRRGVGQRITGMFAFFSSRLGCAGSIIVSVIGTIILVLVMRGCHG